MSDENQNPGDDESQGGGNMDNGVDELAMLKEKATTLGISFSPNLKDPEVLRQRINDHLNPPEDNQGNGDNGETANPAASQAPIQNTVVQPNPATHAVPTQNKLPDDRLALPPMEEMLEMTALEILAYPKAVQTRIIRAVQKKKHTRLIRCEIYCNDSSRNDLKGEILSVSNKYVGVIRKFIPYGGVPYHVPAILLEMIQSKKYMQARAVKNPDGTERVEMIEAPAYTIKELPPLTPEELKDLANQQQARNASVGFVGA